MFLDSSALKNIENSTTVVEKWSTCRHIIIPHLERNEIWILFIIAIDDRIIHYYDPSNNETVSTKSIANSMNKKMGNKSKWPLNKLSQVFCSLPNLNCTADSGVYIMLVIEHFMKQCPLRIQADELKIIRNHCCLQVLSASRILQ